MAASPRARRRLRRGRPLDALARRSNTLACGRCCPGGGCSTATVLARLRSFGLGNFSPRVRLSAANPPASPGLYRLIGPSGIVYSVGRAENLRARIAKHRNASRRLAANIDVSWAVLPSTANLAMAESCEKCRSRPTRDERELFVSAEFERAFEREL